MLSLYFIILHYHGRTTINNEILKLLPSLIGQIISDRSFQSFVVVKDSDDESLGINNNFKFCLTLLKRRTKTHKDTDNFSCHGGGTG
jgi:hypothetical protein